MVHILSHEHDYIMRDGNPENARCRICGEGILNNVVLPEPEVEVPLEFIKYRSVQNHYRNSVINNIRNQGLDTLSWVAVNKIHGTNFSLWVNAEEVKAASRRGWIEKDDDFFGYKRMMPHYKKLVKELQVFYGEPIAVFFEMFGGSYPHPKVKENPNFQRIQKGVFYIPFCDIYVIDIMVGGVYIDWDDLKEICLRFGFRHAPEMNRGSFEAMLNLDPVFPDPIHKDYNLPEIEGNESEGLVIRPVKETLLKSGMRAIIKIKNPKFAEKKNRARKPKAPIVLPQAVEDALDEAQKSITENRVRNILSHGDNWTNKDFAKLVGLIVQDIINEDDFDIEKDDFKLFKKQLSNNVGSFIRPQFINIIDGTY